MDTVTLLFILLATFWGSVWTFLAIGTYMGRYRAH